MTTLDSSTDPARGTVRLLGPTTARITATNVQAATKESLADAVDHIATAVSPTSFDLSISDAHAWLWWFTTPEAGLWEWDEHVLIQLGNIGDADEKLSEALDAGATAQAIWPDDIDLAALGVTRTLTKTQSRDVARMLTLGGGANFSVPGAGKTTMAYVCWAGLVARGTVSRAIVVAPISAHEAWATEVDDIFAPESRPRIIVRPQVPHGDVVVVNYEQLESPSRLEALQNWASFARTLVIFDEAHRAKAGQRGVRGRAARALAHAAARRCVLTGTPRPNGPEDLENVMELAYPGRGQALANAHPSKLADAYCRVTKAELKLPTLVPATERVPLSQAHERVYDAMTDVAARAVIDDPAIAQDLERAGRIAMLLLQAATDPTAALGNDGQLRMTGDRADLKLEALIRELPSSFVPTKFVRVAQLVETHRHNGTKVIVWACFKSHARRLADLLKPHQPALVHGDVPPLNPVAPTDRAREIARFREDPACRVLIATPHTLSEGISLHHTTTHQIHLDRTYNAGMFLQSLDRTHRLGLPSDADCSATYLLAERPDGSETIDHVVARRLEFKIDAMRRVLDDPGLADLAMPNLDDSLSQSDVALGPDGADDLAALFAHLQSQFSQTGP